MLNKFGFLRILRILDARSYRWVIQKKKRIDTRYFTVYYRVNELEYPRVGVIVSKRVSKRAVVRNHVKRMVREWFRLNQYEVKGLSLVIIAKKSAEKAQNIELQTCLDDLKKRLVKEHQSLLLV